MSIHTATQSATEAFWPTIRAQVVSIHAPTRGATVKLQHAINFRLSFNPRAHAGRDTEFIRDEKITREFQSTRPRGARLS